jgi:hypothetical protein
MRELLQKPTQESRILESLEKAGGEWVNGRYFLQTMLISQFHARIHQLQKKGYNIEASTDRDEYGFKSYRLVV